MPNVSPADVQRMVDGQFLFEGNQRAKQSKFWVLLTLSAVIATAGVVADSTATVIGAMIVAPLMTPIFGTAISVVLADERNLLRSLAVVVLGAGLVILIAFAAGLIIRIPVDAETSSQVASRVSPRTIDLVAALATGLVGAFALVRADVSDTLPGVAIAIALVPPLAVVGLTLEAGQMVQALGALVLFATNVAAILATCTLLLLWYGVRSAAVAAGRNVGEISGRTVALVIGFVVILAFPLTTNALNLYRQWHIEQVATPVAQSWASASGWTIISVQLKLGVLEIEALGPPPELSEDDLRQSLDDAGLKDQDAKLTLVLGGTRDLPAPE